MSVLPLCFTRLLDTRALHDPNDTFRQQCVLCGLYLAVGRQCSGKVGAVQPVYALQVTTTQYSLLYFTLCTTND